MNLKTTFLCLALLMISACDSNNSDKPKPDSSAANMESTVPAEQAKSQNIEQPAKEESKPEPAATTVAVTQPLSGEAIYKKTCIGCHATGAANAPKFGDKVAWKPRIEKGMDTLMQSAINGVPGTAMVKRGTCITCSDDDLKAAIEYMVSNSR